MMIFQHIAREIDFKGPALFIRRSQTRVILDDPTSGLVLPKEEINPIKLLSIKQMKALLALPDLSTLNGIRDRTMMELMYSSALRRFEVVKVKIDDFTDDYRMIKVMGKGDKEVMIPVGRMAAYFLKHPVTHVYPKMNRRGRPEIFLSLRSGSLK